jgi:hypothetical protein
VHQQIFVADQTLTFRQVYVDDQTPTGAQLASSAGFRPSENASVLHVLSNGELEDIRPSETVRLSTSTRRFIVVPCDSSFRFTLDGTRFDWPARIISGAVVRKLGKVPDEKGLYLQRTNVPDRPIGLQDLVDLGAPGVEAFVTRAHVWKLNVQGVLLEFTVPMVYVRTALSNAGFNPDQGWQIFLKVAGQPKKPVSITDEIDLRTPGIEKLRLTPKEVNNGEALPKPRRAFALLDVDEHHLDALGLFWETVEDAGRRWLLIHGYPVPDGYTITHILLALEIPPTYPGAQIDMFYVSPALILRSGRQIPNADVNMVILGMTFKRWSRHRGESSKWNPALDNVVTHLALVESAITKEIGE